MYANCKRSETVTSKLLQLHERWPCIDTVGEVFQGKHQYGTGSCKNAGDQKMYLSRYYLTTHILFCTVHVSIMHNNLLLANCDERNHTMYFDVVFIGTPYIVQCMRVYACVHMCLCAHACMCVPLLCK